MGCPIFTYNDILQEAGIILTDDLPKYKDEDMEELEESKDLLSTLSLGELKKQMKEAINDENYERASELRDEINKRKEK
jgi:excinuclease UvrABC helicase subunit UvrB